MIVIAIVAMSPGPADAELATPSAPWIRLYYGKPSGDRDATYQRWLAKSSALPRFVSWANTTFAAPTKRRLPLWVYAGPCVKDVRTRFDPSKNAVFLCNEFYYAMLEDYHSSGMTYPNARHATESSIYFTFLHELGHAVAFEYSIPVLGNAESAADDFAALTLAANPKDQGIVTDAARWFLILARNADMATTMRQKFGLTAPTLQWDEHPIGRERAADVLCLLYGSDPKGLAWLADQRISNFSASRCYDEYRASVWSWRTALWNYTLGHGDETHLF